MDVLESIVAQRRADVEAARRVLPVNELVKQAAGRKHRSLVTRLASGQGTRIVAEVKKASPSAGLLKGGYRPADIAAAYEKAGAVGISVLTEPHRFLGSDADLRAVRAAVDLPVLRKDFVVDAYQVAETAAMGADVLLLIVAAMGPGELGSLHRQALEFGLDVLVEAHTAEELALAVGLDEAIIGVNSRDLRTLKTDLSVARELAGRFPAGRIAIAESGIRTRSDIDTLERAGYKGFLVGEALMRDEDPESALRRLLGLCQPRGK